jgi:hypothetical protein
MRSILRGRDPLVPPGHHGPRPRAVALALALVGAAFVVLQLGSPSDAPQTDRHDQAEQAGQTDEADEADEPDQTDEADPGPPTVRAEGVALARADFRGCVDCHDDVDRGLAADGALSFRHDEHFLTGVTECIACHPAASHEPELADQPPGTPPELTARPTMDRCITCHGLTEIAVAPGDCVSCHVTEVDPEPPSHLVEAWLGRGHADAALDDAFSCQMCHEPPMCESCHGLPMPHPATFDERPHAELAYALDLAACTDCHERAPELPGRDSCGSCHHPDGDPDLAWREAHPEVVRDAGGSPCFACHDPVTCATCHLTGEEDYGSDRARFLAPPTDVVPLRSEGATDPPPRG